MNTKLWRKTLIALIAIEILFASCSTPSTPSQAENQTFEPAETNSEKSSFPTTSPTLETLLTNTDIPIPVTDTPVVVTNTPLPPTDTPLPVTDIPIQGTLIPEARATFTEEPSATLTAPPATTLDNSALLDSLQNQLVFALGGGGGPPPGWACSHALQTYTGPFPAIFLGERSPIIERMGSLCLVGQDLKSGLKVTISGIDGTTFGNAGFEIGEIRGLYGVQENPNANVNLVQTNPVMRVWGGELSRPTGSPVIIQLNIWLPPDVNGDT